LGNATLEVTVLPTLGARIVSLRSRRTGREWLWRPTDGRGLFSSPRGTVFEAGPLAGIDECLPTIEPCVDAGRNLPDHGEAWTSSWSAEARDGEITNQLDLDCLPLRMRRRLTLAGNALRLDYELTNLADFAVRYIWALHPLLAWRPGDRIELHGDSPVRFTAVKGGQLIAGAQGVWPEPVSGVRLDRGELGTDDGAYCKAFLDTVRAPTIALVSDGERLEFTVDPTEIPHWGYWLTQGGWHGHTHLALEPTNLPVDSAAEIPPGSSRQIEAGQVRRWSVQLTLQDAS